VSKSQQFACIQSIWACLNVQTSICLQLPDLNQVWDNCRFGIAMFQNLQIPIFRFFWQHAFLNLIMACWRIWCKLQCFACSNMIWHQLTELNQVLHVQANIIFLISMFKNLKIPIFTVFEQLEIIMFKHAFCCFEHQKRLQTTKKHQSRCWTSKCSSLMQNACFTTCLNKLHFWNLHAQKPTNTNFHWIWTTCINYVQTCILSLWTSKTSSNNEKAAMSLFEHQNAVVWCKMHVLQHVQTNCIFGISMLKNLQIPILSIFGQVTQINIKRLQTCKCHAKSLQTTFRRLFVQIAWFVVKMSNLHSKCNSCKHLHFCVQSRSNMHFAQFACFLSKLAQTCILHENVVWKTKQH